MPSVPSSHRWLNCTPSTRLELGFGDRESNAAREGTAAHALCEHKLKKLLHRRSVRSVSEFDSDGMEECSDGYVSFVAEKLAEVQKSCKDPSVYISRLAKEKKLEKVYKGIYTMPDTPLETVWSPVCFMFTYRF